MRRSIVPGLPVLRQPASVRRLRRPLPPPSLPSQSQERQNTKGKARCVTSQRALKRLSACFYPSSFFGGVFCLRRDLQHLWHRPRPRSVLHLRPEAVSEVRHALPLPSRAQRTPEDHHRAGQDLQVRTGTWKPLLPSASLFGSSSTSSKVFQIMSEVLCIDCHKNKWLFPNGRPGNVVGVVNVNPALW